MSRKFGYCRVSHEDQSIERQIEGLNQQKVVYIYIDKFTGATANRPELTKLLMILAPGDEVVIMSLDRLARNLMDLRNLVSTIVKSGAKLTSLKENLTFTGEDSPMSMLLLSVMGAFAEFERSFIRERQRQGIAIAKAKGAFKGSVRKLSKEDQEYLYDAVDRGVPKTEIARKLKIGRVTVYSYLELRDKLRQRN